MRLRKWGNFPGPAKTRANGQWRRRDQKSAVLSLLQVVLQTHRGAFARSAWSCRSPNGGRHGYADIWEDM